MNKSQNKNLEESGNDKFHFEIEDIDMDKRIPAHMISPNSVFKLIWNFIILLLAVYTAIALPIRLAFMNEMSAEGALFVFDFVTDTVFIMDIILNFFFVEEDLNGEVIIDMKTIAKMYLKSWFLIDLIASIPVSFIMLFAKNTNDGLFTIQFLKLTKFTRLYRLLTLFKIIKLFKNHKYLDIAVSYLHVTPDAK